MRKKPIKSDSFSTFKNVPDVQLLSALQEPLRFIPRPFDSRAKRLGMDVEQFIGMIRRSIASGVIRRFAGIVKHDRAGYRCNAMVAFEVEGSACDESGAALAKFPFITHCYRRTAYRDWPYTLYAMVHARTIVDFRRNIATMKRTVKHQSMVVLPTVKEYKKTRYQLS